MTIWSAILLWILSGALGSFIFGFYEGDFFDKQSVGLASFIIVIGPFSLMFALIVTAAMIFKYLYRYISRVEKILIIPARMGVAARKKIRERKAK